MGYLQLVWLRQVRDRAGETSVCCPHNHSSRAAQVGRFRSVGMAIERCDLKVANSKYLVSNYFFFVSMVFLERDPNMRRADIIDTTYTVTLPANYTPPWFGATSLTPTWIQRNASSTAGAAWPAARVGHTVVPIVLSQAGLEVAVIFGGETETGLLNDTWVYFPTNHTFRECSTRAGCRGSGQVVFELAQRGWTCS